MDLILINLKTKWIRCIPCGKTFYSLAYADKPDKEVLQLTWRDSSMVLFMTNCMDGRILVKKLRKRPAAALRDPQLRTLYGDLPVKRLLISLFINEYNHKMNGVDRADQQRSNYRTARKAFKTWRPLWDYLLFITICNMALILSKLSPL